MGGGIIIQQRAVIRTSANDPAIFDQLSEHCQNQVRNISSKGLDDWTDHEDDFMRTVPIIAKPR